jgi:hypothetical protein
MVKNESREWGWCRHGVSRTKIECLVHTKVREKIDIFNGVPVVSYYIFKCGCNV